VILTSFFFVPSYNILLGFTSGPSGSLKSVGKTMLEQFKNDRSSQITLNLIPKEKEFGALKNLPDDGSLHFKINSSSLSDLSDDAPPLIKNLGFAPYIENNIQLTLDLSFSNLSEAPLTKDNVLEIVSYLSDHEGCSALKVKSMNNGDPVLLDFGNAFLNFKTEINTRNKFIDEDSSINILSSALLDYLSTN